MSTLVSAALKFRHNVWGVLNSVVENVSSGMEGVRQFGLRSTCSKLDTEKYPSPSPESFIKQLPKRKLDNSTSIPANFYLLRPDFKPTRNPVVLCHGLFGFDKISYERFPNLHIHYWHGVADALRKLGTEVVVAKVAKSGSISMRAQQLHEIIEKTLPGREVNLIGHSMGGLDGRYLASRIPNKTYTIGSLTTVSTPHHGSPFMDWCRDRLKVCKMVSDSSVEQPQETRDLFEKLAQYIDAPAYANLTTEYLRDHFNPATPNNPDVSYFSYNAYLDNMNLFSTLHFPWSIINEKGGRNDGLVTLDSGKWGQLVETVQAHHFDLVSRFRVLNSVGGWLGIQDARYMKTPTYALPKALMFSPESNFDNIEFYLRMATFLRSQGF